MQRTRINNVSLFLTVLSTCLGLLVVGMPVEIYAQLPAASAGSVLPFKGARGCGNEIPSEVQELIDERAFYQPIQDFLADLNRLISIDKYRPTESHRIEIYFEESVDGIGRIHTSAKDNWLRLVTETAARQIVESFANNDPLYRFNSEWQQDVSHDVVTFQLDDSGVVINASKEQKSFEHAQKLASIYNSYLDFGFCQAKSEAEKIFYSNTRALVDNNEILVITHLPRAGLDTLSAEQPAAN